MLAVIPEFLTGAEEETRTLTPVRELDPEPSVSTNFTTSAAGMCLDDLPSFSKRFFYVQVKISERVMFSDGSRFPATHGMAGCGFAQALGLAATLLKVRATRAKGATFGQFRGQGDHSRDGGQAMRSVIAQQGGAGHKPL